MPVEDEELRQVMREEIIQDVAQQALERVGRELHAARYRPEKIGVAERYGRRWEGARLLGDAPRELFGEHEVAHRRARALFLLAAERNQDDRVVLQSLAEFDEREIFELAFHLHSSTMLRVVATLRQTSRSLRCSRNKSSPINRPGCWSSFTRRSWNWRVSMTSFSVCRSLPT